MADLPEKDYNNWKDGDPGLVAGLEKIRSNINAIIDYLKPDGAAEGEAGGSQSFIALNVNGRMGKWTGPGAFSILVESNDDPSGL